MKNSNQIKQERYKKVVVTGFNSFDRVESFINELSSTVSTPLTKLEREKYNLKYKWEMEGKK